MRAVPTRHKADPAQDDDQGETSLFWGCANAHPAVRACVRGLAARVIRCDPLSASARLQCFLASVLPAAAKQLSNARTARAWYSSFAAAADVRAHGRCFGSRFTQVVNLLLMAKAKPSHADRDGVTALQLAHSSSQKSARHTQVCVRACVRECVNACVRA